MTLDLGVAEASGLRAPASLSGSDWSVGVLELSTSQRAQDIVLRTHSGELPGGGRLAADGLSLSVSATGEVSSLNSILSHRTKASSL